MFLDGSWHLWLIVRELIGNVEINNTFDVKHVKCKAPGKQLTTWTCTVVNMDMYMDIQLNGYVHRQVDNYI